MFSERRVVAFALTAFASFAALTARAQTTEGSLRGYLRDEQNAVLPGATVTATGAAQARTFSATSDGQGLFRILNLPPDTYTLTAELQGFAKTVRQNVVVRAGLNLSVDFGMKIGTLEQVIDVTAEAPLLETSRSGQAVNVSGEMAQSIPLGFQKHWSEFLRMSPGAVTRDGTTNQAPVFYVHGAGIVSSSTLVDGADMTSAINPWLGYSALPSDTVADVQIKTGGFDASAPLGMGSAANVVIRSGGNKLRGSATYTYAPTKWIDNNTSGGTPESANLTQPEASISGPIQKDKWWFMASYRHRGGGFSIGRPADQIADMKALDPNFTPFDRVIGANIFFAKVNGNLKPGQEFSAFYNRDSTPYESDGPFNTGKFQKTIIGGWGYSARLTSSWNSWLTSRLAFSWNNKGAITGVTDLAPTSRPVFRTVIPSGGRLTGVTQRAILGNILAATNNPYTKWTVTGDMTAFRSSGFGTHEIQVGVFLQPHMTRLDTINYTGTGSGIALEELVFRDANNPAGGTIPFHRRIYDAPSGVLAKGHFADNAIYVQDSWRPVPRLAVNLGLRVDHVTRNDDLFTLELQDSYEVGPRAGINYFLTADQRNAVRVSFMRVHDAPNINAQSASGAGTQGSGAQTIGFKDLYDLDFNGTFETTFVTPAASPVSPNRVIDPKYHQPYADELSFGYRRQLSGRISVDVGYQSRNYKDRTALVEQNGIYEGTVFKGFRNESQNEIFLLTNNQWNYPVYRALELVVTRQGTRFQGVASYTRVFPKMAGTWQPNDPASYIQPTTFELTQGLPSNDNRSASLGNGYATGTSSIEWMNHIARVAAAWHTPWKFLVSGSYSFQKGRWSGPIFTRIAAADPQFGTPTVRLSNGRVVSNPLATTLRFANATRSDGQYQLAPIHQINFRVGREFDLGRERKIGVNFDVFNLPNMGRFQSFLSGADQLFSTNYGRGGEVQPPRSAQLEVRFSF